MATGKVPAPLGASLGQGAEYSYSGVSSSHPYSVFRTAHAVVVVLVLGGPYPRLRALSPIDPEVGASRPR